MQLFELLALCELFLKKKFFLRREGDALSYVEDCPNSGRPPDTVWTEKLRFSPPCVELKGEWMLEHLPTLKGFDSF